MLCQGKCLFSRKSTHLRWDTERTLLPQSGLLVPPLSFKFSPLLQSLEHLSPYVVISLWRPLLFYSPLGERYGRDQFKGSTVLDFILSYFLSGELKEIMSYRIQVNKYDPRGAWDHEGSTSSEMVGTTTWSASPYSGGEDMLITFVSREASHIFPNFWSAELW